MRDYSKVAGTFWIGATGKRLRGDHEAQIVAFYLLTNPHATMLGLYYLAIPTLVHETGLTEEGARKGLRRAIEAGFCTYDEASEYVWVYEMARFQIGDELKAGDKRISGIAKELAGLSKCPFAQAFHAKYADRFRLPAMAFEASPFEGASMPHRSQEQEQEQEQEKNMGGSSPPPRAGFELEPPEPADERPRERPPDALEQEFESLVRPLYPRRHGDHRWRTALGHYRAARKAGEPLEAIVSGVRRYAAFCRDKGWVGTEFVKQASSFFGRDKCWREPWGREQTAAATGPPRGTVEWVTCPQCDEDYRRVTGEADPHVCQQRRAAQ